jgi:hypothetical protein
MREGPVIKGFLEGGTVGLMYIQSSQFGIIELLEISIIHKVPARLNRNIK